MKFSPRSKMHGLIYVVMRALMMLCSLSKLCAATSGSGQYFVKVEGGDLGNYNGVDIDRLYAHSLITCCKECVSSPGCEFVAYSVVNESCILRSNGTEGGVFGDGSGIAVEGWTCYAKSLEVESLQTQCADDTWTYYDGSCYHVPTMKMHWNESRYHCASLQPNAHLVVITTQDEWDFILDLLQATLDAPALQNDHIWVGASDFYSSEGVFEWITGDPWTWGSGSEHWAAGQPSSVYLEDCIAMTPVASVSMDPGKWDDYICYINCKFVCEVEMS